MYEPRYDEQANALFFVESQSEWREIPLVGQRIFVCGSLQNPPKMTAILGREAAFAPALVYGYRHDNAMVAGCEVPFMLPAPEAPTRALAGVVWLGLTAHEKRLITDIELADNLRREILLISYLGEKALEVNTFIFR